MVRDTARTYRVMAAEAESRAGMTKSKAQKTEFKRLAQGWRDLARQVDLAIAGGQPPG